MKRMTRWTCAGLLLLISILEIGVASAVQHDHPGPYDTIEQLWTGVDPEAEPLDIQILDEWTSDSIRYTRLYFTSEYWEGEPVRVYAIQGAPEGASGLPGILHIHGGGQTASLDWVTFWARRGYACVTFDFCGDWTKLAPDRTEFTKWGRFEGGMAVGGRWMRPDARHDPWFHWAFTARRALTLLASHPACDAERIGIYGISVGGTLTWLVAATDPRVKAAVPIYGCGWNTYDTPQQQPEDPLNDPEKLAWRELLQPEHYAPRVKCPVLFLNASQDFHGNMDRCDCTLGLAGAPILRQAITARYNHHIDPKEGQSLPLWMDWHLKGEGGPWPETPALTLDVAPGGVPRLTLAPNAAGTVRDVEVHYALNNTTASSRFWRFTQAERAGEGDDARWTAEAPFMAVGDTLYAFANVTYASGVTLSSRLVTQPTDGLQGARPTLRWEATIDAMDDDTSWYFVPAGTDPLHTWRYFTPWTGPQGERGFTLSPEAGSAARPSFYYATNKLGDPQWRGRAGLKLQIDYYAAEPFSELEAQIIENDWRPTRREFKQAIEAPAAGEAARWRTITFDPATLADADGKLLEGWEQVTTLMLKGKAPRGAVPVFKNLRWTE